MTTTKITYEKCHGCGHPIGSTHITCRNNQWWAWEHGHGHIREIAASHTRQDESEGRSSHNARHGHSRALSNDTLQQALWT